MPNRRPTPTSIPPGAPTKDIERSMVNGWLSEWGDDRRELEAAEKLLETIEADLTAKLRDQFAMVALQGLLAATANVKENEVPDPGVFYRSLPVSAYAMADLMMEARKKR